MLRLCVIDSWFGEIAAFGFIKQVNTHCHLRTIVGHIGVEFPSLTQNCDESLYNHHWMLQLDDCVVMGVQHTIQSAR
jgi:hypothetical protein